MCWSVSQDPVVVMSESWALVSHLGDLNGGLGLQREEDVELAEVVHDVGDVVVAAVWTVPHVDEVHLDPVQEVPLHDGPKRWLGRLRLLQLAGGAGPAELLHVASGHPVVVLLKLQQRR